MDLHPLVIHYPIAFLTAYGIFELIRFQRVIEQPYWYNVKKILILVGWAGSLVAALTGFITTDWVLEGPKIFLLHRAFALTTVVLATVSSLMYLKNKQNKFIIVLALLILISITITGGLGGAMVRGTTFDPTMAPIFKLLGVY